MKKIKRKSSKKTTDPLVQAIEKAINIAGSQSKLALLIGTRPSTVSNWLNRNKLIPLKWVFSVSKATGILPSELRPDIPDLP